MTAFLRPTSLTLVLFGALVLLTAPWLISYQIVSDLPNRNPAEQYVVVRWTPLVFAIAVNYLIARAAARVFETRGMSFGPRHFIAAMLAVAGFGLVAGPAWSRYCWGYFFQRPSVDDLVRGLASIDEISGVTCQVSAPARCVRNPDRSLDRGIEYCKEDPYYCLSGRIPAALKSAGMLSPPISSAAPESLRQLEVLLEDRSLFVSSDPGYDANKVLGGVLVCGKERDGTRVFLAGLGGGEVSNDHRPHYELRWSPQAIHKVGVQRLLFFYDTAGIEGLEWPLASAVAFQLALAFVVLSTLVAAVVLAARHRVLG